MARTEITLPQLGESVTEGTVTAWLKQPGDRVEVDELLFEVSTDKVDTEVPSPVAGYLVEIVVAEGETVDVGTVVAVVADEVSEAAAPSPAAPAAPATEPAAEPAQAPAPAPPAPAASAAPSSPPVAAPGAAPTPAATPPPPAAAAAAPPSPAAAEAAPTMPAEAPVLLSPVVRRLINEHGLDPSEITGTGEGGRITRDDVLALVDAGGNGRVQARAAPPAPAAPAAPPAAATPAPGPSAPASADAAPAAGTRDEVIPFSNIRRRTAEHMVLSKATSPHAAVVTEVDYENLDRVRRRHRDEFRGEEGFSLTYLPFVARATVDAIREFPEVNATVEGETLVVRHDVNLGIAVDLDFKGLLVPVVRQADTKRLRQIAREIHDLSSRAKSKRLSPDDLLDATFTVTNVGAYGTLVTLPIINQPQVAILSTDGVKKRPVVIEGPEGDAIAIHATGLLSLTWDHRAIDGAYCAAFLQRMKEIVETRDWAGELA